jgi:hypothetical protein
VAVVETGTSNGLPINSEMYWRPYRENRLLRYDGLKIQASENTGTNWVRFAKTSMYNSKLYYAVLPLKAMARMARSLRVTARDS